jgi:hypothetical protein
LDCTMRQLGVMHLTYAYVYLHVPPNIFLYAVMHPWLRLPVPLAEPHFPSVSDLPEPPIWSYDSTAMPSSCERANSLTITDKLTADLDECQQWLEYLKKAQDAMRERQVILQNLRYKFSILGFWTQKLPPEILSRVFMATCSDPRGSFWAIRTLPLVCKHWKAVADATTPLWNGLLYAKKSGISPESLMPGNLRITYNPRIKRSLNIEYRTFLIHR